MVVRLPGQMIRICSSRHLVPDMLGNLATLPLTPLVLESLVFLASGVVAAVVVSGSWVELGSPSRLWLLRREGVDDHPSSQLRQGANLCCALVARSVWRPLWLVAVAAGRRKGGT